MNKLAQKTPELMMWAGPECTINRVGDKYLKQLEMTGHSSRQHDLDLIAQSGIRKVRYPVLWEQVAFEGLHKPDWRWVDARLSHLDRLRLSPIVTLLHHGSGPPYTDLLDDDFPKKFADYAAKVALRFPSIECYTPINEPLTTARFSALYGHWYPHRKDDRSFCKALLNQIVGIRDAMVRIREVKPEAQLIQTEDLGTVYGTSVTAEQVDFENARRWVTWDLLAGKVTPSHKMWDFFIANEISADVLFDLIKKPCPADVIGINHYATSDRYLDHKVENYASHCHGGNGRIRYADVEARRVLASDLCGLEAILQQASARYRKPIAITEAHLGGHREEQLRWLWETWSICLRERTKGVNVCAVTAWSFFGCVGWDQLVTRTDGKYESGVYDVSSGSPRPTALAHLVTKLANQEPVVDFALDNEGWWKRATRFFPAVQPKPPTTPQNRPIFKKRRPILILSGAGFLSQAFEQSCEMRALDYKVLQNSAKDPSLIDEAIKGLAPGAVIHTAGFELVDEAESRSEECFRANVTGPLIAAQACYETGIPFLSFSSDLVFDGAQGTPYREKDFPSPLSVYGRSKAIAEERIFEICSSALVIRTGACFGPREIGGFVSQTLARLSEGKVIQAADDLIFSSTYIPDLVHASLDLLIDRATGIWHLSNKGEVSWFSLMDHAARLAGVDTKHLIRTTWRSLGYVAPRPNYSALESDRGCRLPHWQEALGRYVSEREFSRGQV